MTGLAFDAGPHVYTLDGVAVPSVTGVLKASGLIDFEGVPPSILTAALERGTQVHRACQYWLEGDLDLAAFREGFPECAGYLDSLIALFASGRLITTACEIRLASRRYQFAGTCDWIGTFDGVGTILDWATGDPRDVSKDLQTSAYEHAGREWASDSDVLRTFFAAHTRITRCAVRLRKDGGLPTVEKYADPRHWSEFAALLTARQIVARRRKTPAG